MGGPQASEVKVARWFAGAAGVLFVTVLALQAITQ
jgi:hypothetical protein